MGGKIPQYQRNKFASTYVGGPQVDRSGEILTAGIGKAVETVVGMEAKRLGAKEQARIDAQADNALVDYAIDYQNNIKTLEDQYADDPDAFPEAVQNMGIELQNTYMTRIADERVRTRFGGSAGQVVKQSSLAAINWADAKKDENGLLAAKDIARKSSLLVGQSDDVATLTHNLSVAEGKILALPGVGKEEANKILPEMITSHLMQRTRTDPDGLEADLNDPKGPYQKIDYFTDKMRSSALTAIKSQRVQDKKILKQSQDDNQARAIDLQANGDLTIEYLDTQQLSENEADRLAPKVYSLMKKSLLSEIESKAFKTYRANEDSEDYIDLVTQYMEDRVERGKALEVINKAFQDQQLMPEETKQLNALIAPLKTEKERRKVERITHTWNRIKQTLDQAWGVGKGVGRVKAQAQAMRGLLAADRENRDLGEAAVEISKQTVLERLAESGIDTSTIPTEGKRFEDEDGKSVWV